jgi:hypothetical protein
MMITPAAAVDDRASVGDRLLEPLIRAASEDARQREIERLLVTVARPLSERILSRYLRGESTLRRYDADDIISTVMLRLVSRLTAVGASEQARIDDFQNYVASLTYNTVYTFLREQFPQRTRLKNRLRYVLNHDDRLALWTTQQDFVCGLRAWNGASASTRIPTLSRQNAAPSMVDQRNPARAVIAIFKAIGQPVALETLAALTAELWGIRDRPALKPAVIPDPQPSALLAMERREFVASLWKEIQSLRRLQRKALLLNLRDGETVNVLGLFVVTGITSVGEVATVLEMAPDDLINIWNELPLPDARIAELMNVTRQQVINLRKAARKRLIRRLLQSGG